MATPITWQNVNGPSLAEASRPLDSAARAFDMGFGALNNVLAQRNRIEDQNYQTGRNNNTNAFLDAVNRYKTVDELRAAQASGALDQLKSSFGPNIDANAVRGAVDSRLTGLMTQQRQGIEFDNLLKDERSMPFMQAYKTASLRGDKAGMAAAEAGYTNAGGRNLPDLVAFNDNRLNTMTERERATDKHNWAGETHRDNLASSKVQRDVSLGNLEVNRGQLGVAQEGLKIRQAEAMSALDARLQKQEMDIIEKMGTASKVRAGTLAGQETIDKAIAGIEDKNDRKQARLMADQALKKYPDAPTSVIVAAAKGIDADWAMDYFVRSGGVSRVGAAIKDGVGSDEIANADASRDRYAGMLSAVQEQRAKIGVPSAQGNTPRNLSRNSDASGGYPIEQVPDEEYESVQNQLAADEKAIRDRIAARSTAGASNAPVAAPAQSPSEALDRAYEGAMQNLRQKYPGNAQFSSEARTEQQRIYNAREEGRAALEQSQRQAKAEAARSASQAANERNRAMWDRQVSMNASAAERAQATAIEKRQEKIDELKADLRVYANRGSVRDKINIEDTQKELDKLLRRQEAAVKKMSQ